MILYKYHWILLLFTNFITQGLCLYKFFEKIFTDFISIQHFFVLYEVKKEIPYS
jgi:hypothetical protein